MTDTVKAAWNGPYVGEIGTTPVNPGDILDVPADQIDSGHWTAVDGSGAPVTVAPITAPEPSAPVVLNPEKSSDKESSK